MRVDDIIAKWVGKTTCREDIITKRMIDQFNATFAPYISGLALSEELLWLLSPDIEPQSALGTDGHPKLGMYLPNLGYNQRMWAGGEITFYNDVIAEQNVQRRSEIQAITPKSGKSGEMVFVSLRHHYHQKNTLIADERQDIVYRQRSLAKQGRIPTDPVQAHPEALWLIDTNTTLLFRYSAMTFNGHRIHYDVPFATDCEHHDGVLVHGPVQASWLMMLAKKTYERPLRTFSYRSLAPFVCGQKARVTITQGDDTVIGSIQNEEAHTTMTARITLR